MLTGQEKISDLLKKFPSSRAILDRFGFTPEAEIHFRYRNLAHAAVMHKVSLRQVLQELSKVTGEGVKEPHVTGVQSPMKPGFRRGIPKGIQKIIAVHSGKGGVGKTFVAVSLAATLAAQGYKVGLFDSDIDCPNVMEVLRLRGTLKADQHERIVPLKKFGIKVVSMAPLLEKNDQPLLWRGPIISRVIEQFIHDVSWGSLDFLVVDLPAGTGVAPITLLNILGSAAPDASSAFSASSSIASASGPAPSFHVDSSSPAGASSTIVPPNISLIVITTSQNLALLDAKKSIHMARKMHIPVAGIIENMSGPIFGKGGAKKIGEEFKIPALGSIPLLAKFSRLDDDGRPAALRYPALAKIFTKIVEQIVS